MNKVSKLIITTFYITVLAVVSVKMVETVFTGSILVTKGHKVAQLKAQKAELAKQHQDLNQSLTNAKSLASIDPALLTEYAAIDQPIVVEVPTTVASR